MHFEILTNKTTAAGATGIAGTVLAGDSNTVKNGNGKIKIIAGWSTRQAAGFAQLIHPSGHDTTRGLRTSLQVATALANRPFGTDQQVEAQETLQVTMAGSATAGDIEHDSYLLWYENFPGITMKTLSADAVESRTDKMTTIVSTLAVLATGEYNEKAITADSDLLKANRDYAVLGMSTSLQTHALTLKAPDFGNVRVGCPGNWNSEIVSQYFMILSRVTGKPLVPIFNTGNKGQIMLGQIANENAAATVITAHVALLK